MTTTSRAVHVCQRCCNPLELHSDFETLNREKMLAIVDAQRPERPDESRPPIVVPVKNAGAKYPRYVIPPNPNCSSTDAEVVALLQRYSTPTSSLDHRYKVSSCLFDILSGRTDVDHPLCQGCADVLLTTKQKCLEYQEEELKCLRSYLSYLDAKAARAESKLKAGESTFSTGECGEGIPGNTEFPDSSSQPDKTNSTLANWFSCMSTEDSSPPGLPLTVPDSWSDEEESEEASEDDEECEEQNETDSPVLDQGCTTESQVVESANGPECNVHEDHFSTSPSNDRDRKRSKRHRSRLFELQATVDKLRLKLDNVLAEGAKLDQQLVSDTAELERRNDELDRAQTLYNEQKLVLLEEEEELFALEARVRRSERHLERLLRTNVLNTAFPIWYDEHFCIISGLHMGRLPNRPVSWDEINAAWGQCAMLLQCIARKLNHTFHEFRIVPMGSQSKIIDLPNHKEYPLYYTTTGMQLFAASKFDNAMCMFLKCLDQVQQLVEQSAHTKLPYRIKSGGKMHDPRDGRTYSIKWTGNSEENWTKALKMMLLNMKWIIARLVAIDRINRSGTREKAAVISSNPPAIESG